MMISKGQTRSHLSFYRRSWSFCFAVARIFVGHVTRPPPREGTRRNTRSQTCPSEPPTSSPRQKKFRSAASPPPARTPPAPFLLPPRQGGAGSPLRIPHSLRGDGVGTRRLCGIFLLSPFWGAVWRFLGSSLQLRRFMLPHPLYGDLIGSFPPMTSFLLCAFLLQFMPECFALYCNELGMSMFVSSSCHAAKFSRLSARAVRGPR